MFSRIVIPAPAGRWIPAFAGMTENENLPKMGIIIELELWKEAKSPYPSLTKGGRGIFSQTRPQFIEEPYNNPV